MIGAIIGDIVGSRFEWNNTKTKRFDFFHPDCCFTDDTVMTVAVAKAILESQMRGSDLSAEAVKWLQKLGRDHPRAGYGGRFLSGCLKNHPDRMEVLATVPQCVSVHVATPQSRLGKPSSYLELLQE